MATTTDIVEYRLILRDEFSRALEVYQGHTRTATESTNTLTESTHQLRNSVLLLASAYLDFSAIKESMEVYKAQKLAVVELTQVYENNKNTTTESLHGMQELADQQEKLTGIHKEDTEKLEGYLLTHHNLKVSYQQLIPVIEGFAKVHGIGVTEAGDMMVKALAGGSRGLMMLKEAGIDLNHKQMKVLSGMYETGHAAQAQEWILHQLENRYKGVAKAMYEADPEAQLGESWRQAQVEIGKVAEELLVQLMPAIKALIGDLIDVVKWVGAHKEGLEQLGKVVLSAVIAFKAYQLWALAGGLATKVWTASQAIAAGYTAAEAAEVAGLTTAMEILNGVMEMNPFILIAAGLTAVVGGYELFKNHSDNGEQVDQIGQLADKWKDAGDAKAHYDAQFGGKSFSINGGLDKEKNEKTLKAYQDYYTYGFYNGGQGQYINESTPHTKEGKALSMEEWFNLKDNASDPAKQLGKGAGGKNSDSVGDAGALSGNSSQVTGTKQVIINQTINKIVGIETVRNEHMEQTFDNAADAILKRILAATNQWQASMDI